jgi:undecaprenyl-diphosphatase
MLDILKALILGIVQGLTEFLPVSSSGHIELGEKILHFDLGKDDLLFSIIVHFATVLSTIVVFRKDIMVLLHSLKQFAWNEDTQYIAKILLSMVPVAVIGLFFKDKVEALFDGQILLVGCMLLVTALLLFLTQTQKVLNQEGRSVGFLDAFIIGVAQAFAVMPGLSRSGSTIATGLLLGIDKEKIAKFSFLMVLLPIIGITLLDVKDILEEGGLGGTPWGPLLAGFLGAFVAGLFACSAMIRIVKTGKLFYFAIYCALVGAISILFSLL